MAQTAVDYLDLMAAAAKAAGLSPPQIVAPTDCYAELNGIRFHYLDWGNDHLPHVVLLHGGSLQAHTWDMAALLLRERFHLVALSQRGHGDTGWTPDDQLHLDNSDLMLEDTRQFIEHLGFDAVSLVGMSMGGMNTIRYAARHAERLQAVGIVDVAPESMREGQMEMEAFRSQTETLDAFDDFLQRAQKFIPHRAPEHLRYSLTHSLKQTDEGRYTWKQDHRRRTADADSTDAQRQAARAQRADALWADLRAIERPTILFRGAWSKILAPEVAARVIEEMPDARLVEIDRATHNVHSDNPADFAAALGAFLDDVL
ncbi:MAG: alpha/beta hydrolase [Gammaproteobacteria bacterium]|nr:alpha/beta hydrolase [Gammaproteobacteria bacterium]